MADEQTPIKYISLDNLTLYTQLMKTYSDTGDASAIKTVMLSQDGRSLEFYRSTEPISAGTTPDYSIQIPETNLDSCMKKVVSALQGRVATFNSAGQVQDGGILLSDLVTTTDAQTMIATAISQASHMSATIVDTLPADADAADNVMYLYRNTNASGNDVYEIYLKINGRLTMIDDTSVDLTNYYTKTQVDDKISVAKTQAINDAVAQANAYADTQDAATLASAEAYTDTAVSGLNDTIDAVEAKADANTASINTMSTTVQSNRDRIIALENSTGVNIQTATEAEIRALFSST